MSDSEIFMCADVAVVGAGLVGLASAVALHQAGFSVVIIDSKDPTKADFSDATLDAAWDERIYAISPKNAHWLNNLGVWPLLNQVRIGQIQSMEIFGDETELPLNLLASDVNADNLGFVVESKALMNALLKQIKTLGITTLFDNPCEAVIDSANNTLLQLPNHMMIESKLLLAADGSHSWLRQQLNMPMKQSPYEQAAIVANFKVEKSHGNIARQWFSRDADGNNSILAWLPLPDNTISIVWSVSTKFADSLLRLDADEFTQQVKAAGCEMLGELKLISSPVAFPLTLQKTNTLVQNCVVLVGDAAHQVHPMAGQGVNLGFRDVIDLVEILKNKSQYQALNDSTLLKQYSRIRKADILKMILLTDGLYQLFKSQNTAVRIVRNWGLSATKHHVISKLLVENAIAL
ncbi:FAD-dependent oxidoreductase [Methylotenera sp.]|uniref:FAD-dependent oxidoreductase n=1 Tax=Methylotenera sp. TaxID=2051956 RepID=UPI0027337A94|nr:FAD-dependent oxidoreductase [Methylotenera sp.]MDP3307517.1 FAD-dependent monooxygenase [Methylotenera sp.]